jgi:single-strand DNA-binding protein
MNLNKLIIMGRLTRDPETKYLASGSALCTFGFVHNRNSKDQHGEWRGEPTFLDIECWGQTAERVAAEARKGMPCLIEGRLKMDQWERDGQKVTKLKVVADSVQLEKAKSSGTTEAESGYNCNQTTPQAAPPNGYNCNQTGPDPNDDIPF